jgi:uncharacterized protein
MRKLLGFLVLLAALWALAAPTFPALTGRVVDEAHLLPAHDKERLEHKLAALEHNTTIQFVVVTLPTLQGYDIADYGYQLGRHWGIGQKGKDNGILLIVAPKERKVRLEVGYGLEGVITDYEADRIIRDVIVPRFKKGEYAGGIMAGVDAVMAKLSPVSESSTLSKESKSIQKVGSLLFWAAGMFTFWALPFIIALPTYKKLVPSLMLAGVAGVIVWMMVPLFSLAALSALLVFAAAFLIPTSKGGFFGGSSGGGSFGGSSGGGFSGGGGSFGGGGASGSW